MPGIGRLRKRPEFLKVAAARHKWVTPGLILQSMRRQSASEVRSSSLAGSLAGPVSGPLAGPLARPPEDPDNIRVGFTVSRKVGSAVARNRARRRLRAVAAKVIPELGQPGHDYVLIGRGGTLHRPYTALVEDLRTALVRIADDREKGKGRQRRKNSK